MLGGSPRGCDEAVDEREPSEVGLVLDVGLRSDGVVVVVVVEFAWAVVPLGQVGDDGCEDGGIGVLGSEPCG